MSNFTIENGVFIARDNTIRSAVYNYLHGNKDNLPPISNWNVSNVTDMGKLFKGERTFNEPLNNWDVSKVEDMSHMFREATSFNQPLNNWNVSKVENMAEMFKNATSFNQPLNDWDMSKVEDIGNMFEGATSFNQPLNNWQLSKGETMYMAGAFKYSNFNQSLDNWDVSKVTDFTNMFFSNFVFNQPLNNWNVSNARTFRGMFTNSTSFNQPLNNWDVSSAIDFSYMFGRAISFNQPLNNWNINNRADYTSMFKGARSYNQNLSNWHLRDPTNLFECVPFDGTRMTMENLPVAVRPFFVGTPTVQPPQPTTTAIAYQVHNAFNVIQFQKLFELISNNNIDNYSNKQSFNDFMISELQTILSSYKEEDKAELIERFNRLTPKIRGIDYNTDFKMNPNPSGINAFFTIINFVKKQEKHYQDNYIKFFINDSYNAYNSGSDNTSCVKGIKERLIFALGQAGYDIDNPLYKQISEILFPLKDEQLYAFISNCINEKKTELLSIGDSNMEGKKKELLKCVLSKIKESFPNMDAEGLKTRILGLIENSIDMFEDESLKGGRRKRRVTKKRKRETKKTMKKKVNKKQRIKLSRKNRIKSQKATYN